MNKKRLSKPTSSVITDSLVFSSSRKKNLRKKILETRAKLGKPPISAYNLKQKLPPKGGCSGCRRRRKKK
ncbi:MAG: hypothetical protein ACOC5T_10230 [Elusimicrobiota bacterium]